MGTVVEGDGVVSVAGDVDTANRDASVVEGDGAVSVGEEVFIFGEKRRGG